MPALSRIQHPELENITKIGVLSDIAMAGQLPDRPDTGIGLQQMMKP